MRTFDQDGTPNNFMSKQHGSIFEDEELEDETTDVNEEEEEEEEEEDENPDNKKFNKEFDENDEDEDEDNDEESDYISQILKSKGIEDIEKIKYENEDGEIVEISWNDLPDEDKINILTQQESPETEDNDLSQEEVDLLNFMRKNNFSQKDLQEYFKKEAIKELNENQEYSYSSDDYSDDDLVFSRYKEMFPKTPDDDILVKMEKEKEENEELYKQNADEIRQYYKGVEYDLIKQSELEEQEKSQAEMQEFKESIVNTSNEINHIDELELEQKDKEDVISYILDQDANGASRFAKDLNDPKKLFLAAWFLAKGDEAFKTLTDYYKNEIDKSRKTTNIKPANVIKPSNKTQVVVKPSRQKQNKQSTALHDLYEGL